MRSRTTPNRSRTAGVAAVLAGLALAMPAAAQAGGCPSADQTPSQLTIVEARTSVLCLINQRRRSHGLRALRGNRKLARAAQRHSNSMDRDNFFSHTSPNGATLVDRISKTGYFARSRSWGVGEDLEWGTRSAGSPRGAVVAWMKSAGHRRVLLDRHFRQIGLGIAFGSPIGQYENQAAIYTADFGYH